MSAHLRAAWASLVDKNADLSFNDIGATWRNNEATTKAKASFDVLSPNAPVIVYHGTTQERARSLVQNGVVAVPGGYHSDLPSLAYDHLYVAPTRVDAANYGPEIVSFTVRKEDILPSPEALRTDPHATGSKAFFNSFDGAIIAPGHRLNNVRIAKLRIEGGLGPNDSIYRAERNVMIPYKDEPHLSGRQIVERAIKSLTVEGYGPHHLGRWWMVQGFPESQRLSDAKFWAFHFSEYGGNNGDQAGIGFIYEARFLERPPWMGSNHFPVGQKLHIVAIHVTLPNEQWERVSVDFQGVVT